MNENSEATVLLNANDNVAVVRRSIPVCGATDRDDHLVALELIGRWHKVALKFIKTKNELLKYDKVIRHHHPGYRTRPACAPAQSRHGAFRTRVSVQRQYREKGVMPEVEGRTFMGYVRHPNFGGILLISLGCAANQVSLIFEH